MALRIAQVVEARGISPHAFMLEAIQEKLDAEEAHAGFVAVAESRLVRMRKTGKGLPSAEVFEFLAACARGEKIPRPRARKIS